MKYRIKATNEIIELRTWRRDDGAIKLVDKYGKMGFWPDEVEPAEHLGWHPASELPPVNKNLISELVLCWCVDSTFGTLEPKLGRVWRGEWCFKDVKWWCYPPKED